MSDPLSVLPPPPPLTPVWPALDAATSSDTGAPASPASIDFGGHRGTPLAPVRWAVPFVFGLVISFVGLAYASSWLAFRSGIVHGLTPDARAVVFAAMVAAQYLLPILLIAWWTRVRGVGFLETFALRRFDVGAAVSMAVGFAVVARLLGIQYSVLMHQLGVTAPETIDVTRLFPMSPIGVAATVLTTVVVAPLAEEALFRGVVFAGLRDRWGQIAGIVVSSVLFALVHHSWYQFAPILVLGVLLAILASSTRSIWPSILCHASFNASGVAMLYFLRATGVLG